MRYLNNFVLVAIIQNKNYHKDMKDYLANLEIKGFYADVIKNKNDVVIVYRGTDNVDGLKDDLKMWYQKQLPTQEREALDLYRKT